MNKNYYLQLYMLCEIQKKNCLYYVNERVKKGNEASSKEEGRNVLIRMGNTVVVKEMLIEDNLGESRSVNNNPPGEVEVICKDENTVVKQTRFNKFFFGQSED